MNISTWSSSWSNTEPRAVATGSITQLLNQGELNIESGRYRSRFCKSVTTLLVEKFLTSPRFDATSQVLGYCQSSVADLERVRFQNLASPFCRVCEAQRLKLNSTPPVRQSLTALEGGKAATLARRSLTSGMALTGKADPYRTGVGKAQSLRSQESNKKVISFAVERLPQSKRL